MKLDESELLKINEIASLLNGSYERVNERHFIKLNTVSIMISKGYGDKIHRWRPSIDSKYNCVATHIDSVGINLDRPVKDIANALKKRLIPDAVAWSQSVRDSFIKRENKEAQELYLLNEILKANRYEKDLDSRSDSTYRGKSMRINSNQFIDYLGKFSFQVNVHSLDAAKLIARICADDQEFLKP